MDDNAINLKLLVVFAKRQGLWYSEATNGLEALEAYMKAASSPVSSPQGGTPNVEEAESGLKAELVHLPTLPSPSPSPFPSTSPSPSRPPSTSPPDHDRDQGDGEKKGKGKVKRKRKGREDKLVGGSGIGSGSRGRLRPQPRPFDYVLIDLSMPVMNGLEATRRIRKFEAEQGLPRCAVVALTGLASAQDQRDAVDAGVDVYLVKPVRFADVRRLFAGTGASAGVTKKEGVEAGR